MSDPIHRVQEDAEPEAPQPGAAPTMVSLRPERTWKYLLAIGLVIAGVIATILWTILLILVVYLIVTR
jgi:hypothetical protein